MKAVNEYWLPIPRTDLKKMDKSSSPVHVGKLRNAIDFLADVGTSVLAAAEGIVTWVKDDSYTWRSELGILA